MSKAQKTINSPLKSKFGKPLGFRTPDHFKGKTANIQQNQAKFNPATFKTQHKG